MVIARIEVNFVMVPIFILLFIILYYIKGNAYKLYNITTINNKEIKKIEEEKKWIKHKKKLAIITGIKLIGTGVILFFARKFIRKYIRKFE